jgi:hypothetical protein
MRRSNASLVLSVVAVLLALAGTAVASGYLITSTKQIKPSVRKALKGNRGPRGFSGADGAPGAAGTPGSPGILSLMTVDSPTVTIAPGDSSYDSDPNSLRAQCPGGSTVVGSGFDAGIGNVDFVEKFGTFVGGFVHNDTSITIQASVQAICAQLPPGVAATRSTGATARFEAAQRAVAAVLS